MKSDLGRGSIILLITINIFNILNFVFNFLMGRLLGPVEYGTLAVLMSLIYIYNVPVEAIQNIVSRYTSKFNLKKEKGKINFLVSKTIKKSFNLSVILFILIAIFSIFLSNYLGINYWLIIIANTYIFFALIHPVLRGALQGRKKFSEFGFIYILEAVFKILLAVALVVIGFKVFGAIIGVILGSFISLFFSFYYNKNIFKVKKQGFDTRNIYTNSIPYIITMFVVFFIFSIDILLAKRFFSPVIVGQYSVISILGKTVFMATLAISKAMFPLTSEKHDDKKNPSSILKKSFSLVSIICIISVIMFALIPNFIISILYGKQFLELSSLLVYTGLAYTFLSLGNLIFIYGLSINKLRKSYLLTVFIITSLILLFIFNDSIAEFTLAFMFSNLLLFIGSLLILLKRK